MSFAHEIAAISSHSKLVLPLHSAHLSDEYRYQSLPLCVIDAVFSIGVKYDSTRRVVIRYCEYTKQQRIRSSAELPPLSKQESISSFCARPEQKDPDTMASSVYRNRQRTSARNGILKSDAALRFGEVLQRFGVEYLQDVRVVAESRTFTNDILSIPGQRSGISLQYFWMLAGSDEFIKPDRMVIRFLETALNRSVDLVEATELLRSTSQLLSSEYPNITPRLLDHEIWKYQRERVIA